MIERLTRHPIAFVLGAIALLVVLSSTLIVVPETKQGVILRFGQPIRILNKYDATKSFGGDGAGLIAKVPFIEEVTWIDKRILSITMDQQQVLSTDQLRLQVDAFARFRIVDPLRMVITARNSDNVASALRPILGSALRNELGKRSFASLLSPERGQVMDNIQAGLNRVARQYGAEIVDVRIKRADLPSDAPLESALTRMRSARQQEALTIQAQGLKQAQIIRAQADADSAKVYADAFGKDPSFYDFYRAMQSYEQTFTPGEGKGESSIILSPDNSYLREFQGRTR
jgi:modulator of FtsH protease HflC